MKCNPWRWLWGLIPILMLGAVAVLGERHRIEEDLTARTMTVLERSGYGWANVTFEGRDAVLSGSAGDESEPARAVAAALDTMGVRVVDNRVSLVTSAARFEWSATRRGDRIRIDGLVPSDTLRRDVIGMVRASFPSLEVDDRMKLARGAPPADVWLGGVGFGLKQLALLREGRVDLEHADLSIHGDALDARSYRAVKAAVSGRLPQGIRLKGESVRPPRASPYAWSAQRQGKEVILVGHVPSDTVRDELKSVARTIVPDAKVVDRMEPAFGAPEGFVDAANGLLRQLGRLEEGSGRIRDRSAALEGLAETAERAGEVKRALGEGALASFRASGDIRHREPAIKTITPYETMIEAEAGALVLKGYAPDDTARAVLVALARERFAGLGVRDELKLGAGQPPGWAQCLEAGLEVLRKVRNGRAALTGRQLVITGTTDAEALVQSLAAEVRTRAGSACDAEARLTLDLAAIQAREEARRRSEERAQTANLEAERQRADEERRRAEAAARQQADEERRRAEAAARQQADEERRRAEATARQQADEERRRAEAAARQQADEERRRAEAAARQQADEERRRAEAAARQQADEERRRAEAAARQKAVSAPRPRTEEEKVVDVCQEALSRVVREGIINFSRASFDLDPASFPTLNKVADAANRCPSMVVEIEGHTDSEGTPERNQRLSDRRANSVREYLSRAGVEPSRLVAVGYGQSHNIATNETPEGRAMNRRIEFTVKIRK